MPISPATKKFNKTKRILKRHIRSIDTNKMNLADKHNLEDKKYYLCIEIETEWERRGARDEYTIFMGRYSKIDTENDTDATFHDVMMLQYTVGHTSLNQQIEYPTKFTDPHLGWFHTDTYTATIANIYKIYKLKKKPNQALITELKREINKLKWAPETNPSVSFVGEKFRKAVDNAAERGWGTQKTKGGKTRKNRN